MDRYTLRQIFTFAQLNNWYNMTDEEKEKEQIAARMEADKAKPITREDLIKTFASGVDT